MKTISIIIIAIATTLTSCGTLRTGKLTHQKAEKKVVAETKKNVNQRTKHKQIETISCSEDNSLNQSTERQESLATILPSENHLQKTSQDHNSELISLHDVKKMVVNSFNNTKTKKKPPIVKHKAVIRWGTFGAIWALILGGLLLLILSSIMELFGWNIFLISVLAAIILFLIIYGFIRIIKHLYRRVE